MSRAEAIHVRDPLHGSVRLTPDEQAVVQSRVVQRLRWVRQLGFADHAFPGATHTRYAHSLGAMAMAGRMFDAIFPPGEAGALSAEARARLRQLLRLAALLHDAGHPPLSHATECCLPERAALGLGGGEAGQATHEDMTALLLLRTDLADLIRARFGGNGITPELIRALIAGRPPDDHPVLTAGGVDHGPLLSQIVAGEMDADRMDYLKRDAFYAGVNYGTYDEHWLLENLGHHVEGDRAFLALSHRAIFAFEDFLLSRYHMFVSVYYHHGAVSFDTMLGRCLEDDPARFALPADPEAYLGADDITFWSRLRASPSPWARAIVERRLYRRVLEINTEAGQAQLAALARRLDAAGVDYFVSAAEGVLSRYYGTGGGYPMYVVNRALGRVEPIGQYSRLFERYAQPARLERLFCRPDQVAEAERALAEMAAAGGGG